MLFFFDLGKIYKEDIVKIVQNGAVIRCPGLFVGEVIAKLDPSNKVITFTMMATNPDLDCFSSVFSDLVSNTFVQCILIRLCYFSLLFYKYYFVLYILIELQKILQLSQKSCALHASKHIT